MRNHTLRLYVVAATLVAFFILWVVIAAKPWASSSASAKPEIDPRLAALDRWERQLRHETTLIKRTNERRWADYRRRLREREAQIAAAKAGYAQQVAAAQAAEARIAAMQQQQAVSVASRGTVAAGGQKTVTTYTVSRVQSAPIVTHAAAAPAPPPVTRVVTLPPQVQVVTLPPASAPSTHSSSSK